MLLGINIHITSEHCTPEHPYNMITSSLRTRAEVMHYIDVPMKSLSVETRIKNCEGIQCGLDIIRQLQKIMEAVSPYAAAFKHMYEVEKEQTTKLRYRAKNILMIFKRGRNQRRYNEPRHDEVAAVFVSDEGAPPMERDIIIYPKDTPCKRISYISANCDH